jgi:peroxiredoxin
MFAFDVVDLPETDHVAEGETAPDFTRPLVNGEFWEDASLSELTDEGPVCLVFYSMDGSFPATYIWNELRDRNLGDLLTVVGVSISTPYAHKRLIERRDMNFDLFADPANDVARDYGVETDLDGMAGIEEPRPATFLLDEDRTVRYAWVAEEWPDFPPYDDVENEIRTLVD